MDREIPQYLHTDAVFLGMAKEEVLAIVVLYGVSTTLFDAPIIGSVIGLVLAYILMKWKEDKPRGIVYHKLRRIIPIEAGIFNTGVDPLDRRIIA